MGTRGERTPRSLQWAARHPRHPPPQLPPGSFSIAPQVLKAGLVFETNARCGEFPAGGAVSTRRDPRKVHCTSCFSRKGDQLGELAGQWRSYRKELRRGMWSMPRYPLWRTRFPLLSGAHSIDKNASYLLMAVRIAPAGAVGASNDFTTGINDLEALISREGVIMEPVVTRPYIILSCTGKETDRAVSWLETSRLIICT